MSDREKNLDSILARINSDLVDYKKTQSLGGDSWIVYRYRGSFSAIAGAKYRIDFTPDHQGEFVAQLWQTDSDPASGTLSLFYPDPQINGRWYFIQRLFTDRSIGYTLYSTKKGSIEVIQVSPADGGV